MRFKILLVEIYSAISQKTFKKMLLQFFPSEMLVEIATYLGSTRNLVNFKLTCRRIYNAIESEKVDRKSLPQVKIRNIEFLPMGIQKIRVQYEQKNNGDGLKRRFLVSLGSIEHKIPHSHPTLDSGRRLYDCIS